VFVVIIHNGINEENFAERNLTVEIPVYVETVKSLIGIITAIAVPMFFLVSAFLLYAKDSKFTDVIKKKSRTLLLPYMLWNVFFVLLYFLMQSLPFTKAIFNSAPENLIRNYTWLDWIDVFAGKFTERREFTYPFVFQFWFLRDLIILNVLFVGIKKLIDTFPFGTIVLFFMLWIGGIKIYIVSPEALLFFSFGYYIIKYSLNEKYIDAIKLPDVSIIYLITILAELLFKDYIPIIHKINILIGSVFFIKLSWYAVKNAKLYNVLARLEKHEFMVYALHGIIISQLIKISVRTIPMRGGFILFSYFGVIILSILMCLCFSTLFKKICPKGYAVLTGGRL
jgi:fucose 4-O-acetylase-like acetyltransferase